MNFSMSLLTSSAFVLIFIPNFCDRDASALRASPLTLSPKPTPQDVSQEHVADCILEIIRENALKTDIDAESVGVSSSSLQREGTADLKKQILHFVKNNKPIRFTLVGFPFKSGNTEKKVIGSMPDLGERLALENLHNFMERVSKIYVPGAKLDIYTDGLAFFDVLNIPLENLLAYEKFLKQLTTDLPTLSIITAQDLFPGMELSHIQDLIKKYPTPLKTLTSAEHQVLQKRLEAEFDSQSGKYFLKGKSIHPLAYEMNNRSQKINAIYKSKMLPSIRLSVHYQKNIGKKVGIALLPGTVTPWHGVALLDRKGRFSMRSKCDVPENARILSKTINGISCYYYGL